MKWLDPATEKGLKNFLAHQSPLQQSPNNLSQGLQLVDVCLSHTIHPVGMRDGMATHKRGEQRIGVIPQQESCSLTPDRRVGHRMGKVGINLRPRWDQDVHIA
jgi:hypothetical protein